MSTRYRSVNTNVEEQSPLLHQDTATPVQYEPQIITPKVAKPTERLSSLDCFRGFTIFFMNWVNNAEYGNSVSFKPFSHSDWNGVTIADLVMPFFLFIVGASIVLSHTKLKENGVSRHQLLKKGVIRSLKLFGLGLFLQGPPEGFPYFDLSTIRIFGVLQRIGITYLITVIVELYVPSNEAINLPVLKRGPFKVLFNYMLQWAVFIVLLAVYLGLTFGLDVPGCGRGSLKDSCNAAGYIDEHVLTPNHMYPAPTCLLSNPPCKHFDPEGLLSTTFATSSVLIGVYYGYMITTYQTHKERLMQWIPTSIFFVCLSLPIHFTGAMPFNKNIYSVSYVFLTAGLAGSLFSIFYVIIDVKGFKKPFLPFIWQGMNAIIIYFGDSFLPTMIMWFYWKSPDRNFYNFVHDHMNDWFGDHWGDLVWGFCDSCFWLCIAAILYRKRIFFKV